MNTDINILEDLSRLTKIPHRTLISLTNKEMLCIGSAIHEAQLSEEKTTILDIGLGTLSVNLASGECKFIPSKDLTMTIKKVTEKGLNPLEFELSQSVITKLVELCEDNF
jgi:hypothetical protein